MYLSSIIVQNIQQIAVVACLRLTVVFPLALGVCGVWLISHAKQQYPCTKGCRCLRLVLLKRILYIDVLKLYLFIVLIFTLLNNTNLELTASFHIVTTLVIITIDTSHKFV